MIFSGWVGSSDAGFQATEDPIHVTRGSPESLILWAAWPLREMTTLTRSWSERSQSRIQKCHPTAQRPGVCGLRLVPLARLLGHGAPRDEAGGARWSSRREDVAAKTCLWPCVSQ